MKKFLSTVLALVMVLTTFAMLVPNALAATEQNVEAKVLYEENFDDLNGKTPAEILAGANMKDEQAGMLEYLSVEDGRLKYGAYAGTREEYVILTDDRLLNGYTLEYDMTYIENHSSADAPDNAVSFHAHGGPGNQGYVSQIRWNGGVISGVNTSTGTSGGWGTPGTTGSTAGTGGSANAASTEFKKALGLEESATFDKKTGIIDKLMHVKVDFDKANRSIKTYVNDVLVASGTPTEAADSYFTNTLRLVVAPAIVAKIDNIKVTTMGASPEVLMNETFDSSELLSADTEEAILEALDWERTVEDTTPSNGMRPKCENNALILGRPSTGHESLILVEDSVDSKNGFVVEYDFEFIQTTGAGTGGNGIAFHSAKTGAHPKHGWTSQFRWGRNVLSGACDTGWVAGNYNNDTTYNESHIQTITRTSGAMNGFRVAVKAVFDPQNGYVTTYAKIYTGEALTWSEADAVQKSPYLGGLESLFDGTVRLTIDGKMLVYLDNIKVTALEKTPNVYGYQVSTDNAANIRLLGVIDNDIFTKAEKVGFRVTMTKAGDVTATKDIDCEYVYSSITQWGADTPTQAADMLFGASHIYALHVNGIDEAVTITVTPYYVDEGVTYFGDAATIEYDPAA